MPDVWLHMAERAQKNRAIGDRGGNSWGSMTSTEPRNIRRADLGRRARCRLAPTRLVAFSYF